jgi:hypothetical protein
MNVKGPVERVKRGDYGSVLVIRGKHRGKVGHYDDDDSGVALVYFGKPFTQRPAAIRHSSLVRVDVKVLALERWRRKYPDIARLMGVM